MSDKPNGLIVFVTRHPWWSALIAAVGLSWIPTVGPLIMIGAWIAIGVIRRNNKAAIADAKRGTPSIQGSKARRGSGVGLLNGETQITVSGDPEHCSVVGMQYYYVPNSVVGATVLRVTREPENPHDSNALKVSVNGHKIGHISAWNAAIHAPEWDELGIQWIDVPGCVLDETDAYVEIPSVNDLRDGIQHTAPGLSSSSETGEPSASSEPRLPQTRAQALEPLQPWGKTSVFCTVEDVDTFKAGIIRVCTACGQSGRRGAAEISNLTAHVCLTPNKKLAVYIDNNQVGIIPDDLSLEYLSAITRLDSKNQSLAVPASIWMARDYRFQAYVRIKLPLADEIEAPIGMPEGAVAILPRGNKIQVTGEEDYLETLLGILEGEHSVPVVVELCSYVKQLKTTTRVVVGVKVCGERVGMLSPQMSQHFLPVVEACEEEGVFLVCAARVTGNQLKVDVVLDALKGSELPPGWVSDNVYGHGARIADAGNPADEWSQGSSD